MKYNCWRFLSWGLVWVSLAAASALATSRSTDLNTTEDGHEYAPLQTVKLLYRDWTYPGLDGTPTNLRTWMQGKKLVLVVYFAPWCGNWRYEAEVLSRLHAKYQSHGLGIIAVSEYGATDETRAFFGDTGPPYRVVIESEDRSKRGETTHALYRRMTGDFRTYGSPYNIFLDPAAVMETGEVLAEQVTVANGELIEAEAEAFIREKLGLPAVPAPATIPSGPDTTKPQASPMHR
ncbi:MAG: TlpA family protein disulfide reductase [Acidobacteriota bacterium]